jgi:hypothetical protein
MDKTVAMETDAEDQFIGALESGDVDAARYIELSTRQREWSVLCSPWVNRYLAQHAFGGTNSTVARYLKADQRAIRPCLISAIVDECYNAVVTPLVVDTLIAMTAGIFGTSSKQALITAFEHVVDAEDIETTRLILAQAPTALYALDRSPYGRRIFADVLWSAIAHLHVRMVRYLLSRRRHTEGSWTVPAQKVAQYESLMPAITIRVAGPPYRHARRDHRA